MAKNQLHACVFHQPNMLFAVYGHAVPIDTWDIHRSLTAGFTKVAQRIIAPISWGGPPILQRISR